MSRHIRAQTTQVMQRKGVQLPQHVTLNRCCPNVVKESRSERVGLYQNEQGGFACLALLKIIYFFIGVNDHIIGITSIERGQTPVTEKEHNQCNATI